MKINIRAAGIIKSGAERTLIDDYIHRARNIGCNIGFRDIYESELDIRSLKNKTEITKALISNLQPSDKLIIMDETGKTISSRLMANSLKKWRDNGERQAVFLIGGADGFDENILADNMIKWQMGAMTWPHKLARIMLAEQIYRSLSILAATPYHRD